MAYTLGSAFYAIYFIVVDRLHQWHLSLASPSQTAVVRVRCRKQRAMCRAELARFAGCIGREDGVRFTLAA